MSRTSQQRMWGKIGERAGTVQGSIYTRMHKSDMQRATIDVMPIELLNGVPLASISTYSAPQDPARAEPNFLLFNKCGHWGTRVALFLNAFK